MSLNIQLNQRAVVLCKAICAKAAEMRIERLQCDSGATILDFGVQATGGLSAGLALAEVCLADLAQVRLTQAKIGGQVLPYVSVSTDHPVISCMASQYAGWQIKQENFFAMGSGPMRAVAAKEPLLDDIHYREQADAVVGVLETGKLPPAAACHQIADDCGIDPQCLTLLAARTSSMAGNVQIVARSLETALHKMHELKFDLSQVLTGFGSAPLPPVAVDDMAGIGRTNDAVLYGGQVTLWMKGDDKELAEKGPQIPSFGSADFGRPFAEIFARYNHNFYQIDPQLFSPAQVTINNVATGNSFRFGDVRDDVLLESFGLTE